MGCCRRRLSGGLPQRPLPILAALTALFFVLDGMHPVGAASRSGALRLFVRSPVLVRAGERVRIPVDAVCSTPSGAACRATVRLRYRSPDGTWRTSSAPASPGLRFEAAGPSSGAGAVRCRVAASRPDGSSTSVPGPGEGRALTYYVTDDMPALAVPAVP